MSRAISGGVDDVGISRGKCGTVYWPTERGWPLQPLIISIAPHSSQCVHIVRSPSALGYADKRSFGICVQLDL